MDLVDELIQLALREDLGPSGDLTSLATIPATAMGSARFLAKEQLTLSGLDAASRVFAALDARCVVSWSGDEGSLIEKGTVFGTVRGPARALLSGERTALNLLQRLSGIATTTQRAVASIQGTKLRLLDTRKTTPGLRVLEKAAVRAGGGHNHRLGLFDGVLIKDNHIASVGSVREAVLRAKSQVHALLKVECEVTNLVELDEAIAAGADIVLLDNMDDALLAQAVARTAGRVKLEASGNMTLERLPRIAALGVDYVSMGALTHSARAVDISLEMDSGRLT